MPGNREERRRRLLATFGEELSEHLSLLNRELLALEEGPGGAPDAERMASLFRAAHSIKGASRAVGVRDVETLAHRMEDLLGAARSGGVSLGRESYDALFRAADAMPRALAAHLAGGGLAREELDALVGTLDACLKKEKAPAPEARSPVSGKHSLAMALDAWDLAPDQAPTPPSTPAGPPRPSHPPLAAGSRALGRTLAPEAAAPPESGATKPAPREGKPAAPGRQPLSRETTGPAPDKAPASGSAHAAGSEFLRVKRDKVDGALDLAGELAILAMRLSDQVASHCRTAVSEDEGRVLSAGTRALSRLSAQVAESVRSMRMLPVGTLLDGFPRLVRDLARDLGKEAALSVAGASVEADRDVLEALKSPLTHLVRNCLDHGLETPDRREAAGKPRKGTVRMEVSRRGPALEILVADDGAGVDPEAVRRAALRQGLVSPERAGELSEAEILDLIFSPGLSSRASATDVSGRGVGLDVVRECASRLHGRINVESERGRGARFTLVVPLSLATTLALVVEAGGQTLAVPALSVERVLRVAPEEVRTAGGRAVLEINGDLVPADSLARVLSLAGETPEEEKNGLPFLLVRSARMRAALSVDRVHAVRSLVVRRLSWPLSRVRGLSGAALMPDGRVVVLVNPGDLPETAGGGTNPPRPPFGKGGGDTNPPRPPFGKGGGATARPLRVLVVDDSITTRTLEKNILEENGFSVAVAPDGARAWELLQDGETDVVVSDVDMPVMNGLDLTGRLKADARFKDLPVILVTSLESREDRIRGMQAGADAYILKSDFDQRELVDTVRRLAGKSSL